VKKAFTLLEMIVVIIIVGVLASLGFGQYTRVIEKGRSAEAKANLATLRQLELVYFQEYDTYTTLSTLDAGLPGTDGAGGCSSTSFYFGYACNGSTGKCGAYRCTSGGKSPNATTFYHIELSPDGSWGGTAGYY